LNNKSPNIKIGLFIDSLGTGGAQRQTVNLAIGLKSKGLIPIIIIYSDTNYFQEVLDKESIPVYYVKRRNIADPFFFFQFLRILKNEKIDLLIAMLFIPSGYALVAKVLLPSLHLIISERSFEAKTRNKEKIFPRKLYRWANYITANSKSQTLQLEQLFPNLREKIKYIPNGVHDQEYLYQPKENELTVVSIGRVSFLKDTKVLIKAIYRLKVLIPNMKLKVFWVGAKFDSNSEDCSYYTSCCEMLKELGMDNYWEWIGQISDVKTVLAKSDLLVHMSHGEGFPNAICEALSFGIPVIASAVMDHPFIINHKKNGYLVESGNLEGLVGALHHFALKSIEQRSQMSKNAFQTAQVSFSLEKMTSRYYQLIMNRN